MHGLGNDFVVIDNLNNQYEMSECVIRFISDRHKGVGCDQVLVVEQPEDKQCDFRYRIFNADGSEVAQCGNGARCFARYVHEKKLKSCSQILVETHSRHLRLVLLGNNQVKVDMGEPLFSLDDVPALPDRLQQKSAFSYEVMGIGFDCEVTLLSMGNPHAVLFVEDIDFFHLHEVGSRLETHEAFPERANIGFAQVKGPHTLKIRVWERGAGETISCGSGACAAAVAGIVRGKVASPVTIDSPGGLLLIEWSGTGSVSMTGMATTVFEGEILIPRNLYGH